MTMNDKLFQYHKGTIPGTVSEISRREAVFLLVSIVPASILSIKVEKSALPRMKDAIQEQSADVIHKKSAISARLSLGEEFK